MENEFLVLLSGVDGDELAVETATASLAEFTFIVREVLEHESDLLCDNLDT